MTRNGLIERRRRPSHESCEVYFSLAGNIVAKHQRFGNIKAWRDSLRCPPQHHNNAYDLFSFLLFSFLRVHDV